MSHFLAIIIDPEFFDFAIYELMVVTKIGIQSFSSLDWSNHEQKVSLRL